MPPDHAPVRVVCAPDSFKGSLSAAAAAAAMGRGLRRASATIQVDLCPVADGGEGTVDALVMAGGGELRTSCVMGPRGRSIDARWGLLTAGAAGRTAVVELASAAGLTLLAETERDPAATTTFGVGQLIAVALDADVRQIILGIGGSATCEGGCGAVQALGAHFFDRRGRPIEPTTPICGGMLFDIGRVGLQAARRRFEGVKLTVACDVDNPLVGPRGAASVYGPQKGASPWQVKLLDEGLAHLAEIWRAETGRDVTQWPGAGAAGGFGGGAIAMLAGSAQVTLRSGIELVLTAVDFARRLQGAALVLTGEGKLDGQTLSGKAVAGVARAARCIGVPVVALVGRLGEGVDGLKALGLTTWRTIGDGLDECESMRRANELIENMAERVGCELMERGGTW